MLARVYACVLPDKVKVTDISLKLDVDFDGQILDGNVTLTVEKVDESATNLVK